MPRKVKAIAGGKLILKEDVEEMRNGEILVAGSTKPQLIIAFGKSAAIVTDEGGITSHAAIVSREFGIPCIVGSRHATRIFKDGDLIEVDATKGIARKLRVDMVIKHAGG